MQPTRQPPNDLVTGALSQPVTALLTAVSHWSPLRIRQAIVGAGLPSHRGRRETARALCESILVHEGRSLEMWLVRDAVRTVLASSAPRLSRREADILDELIEDAALALLARPGLPVADLAVLLGPCLPLPEITQD